MSKKRCRLSANKVKFATHEAALIRAGELMVELQGKPDAPSQLRAYKCPHGDHYHLTSAEPKNRKSALLSEIERLKRDKPENWKRDARATLRALQHLTREDDYRETIPNGDKMGHELVGRKCRSTRIQPPI